MYKVRCIHQLRCVQSKDGMNIQNSAFAQILTVWSWLHTYTESCTNSLLPINISLGKKIVQ